MSAINNDVLVKRMLDMVQGTEMSKHKQGLAKLASIVILIGIFVIGVIASFGFFPKFSMDNYVKFLQVALWPLMTLIISIGFGTVTKNLKKEKKDEGKVEGTVEQV